MKEFNLKMDSTQCRVCGKAADDATGQWRIVKAFDLVAPLGWLPPGPWQDWLMFGLCRPSLVCSDHTHTTEHTIVYLDDCWRDILFNRRVTA